MKIITLMILIIRLGVYFSVCGGSEIASCNTSKCYHSVNATYQSLLDLIQRFNLTTSSAKLPYEETYHKDLKKLENIQKETKKINSKLNDYNISLNQCQESNMFSQETVEQLRRKFLNISHFTAGTSELNNMLTQAKDQYEKFKELVDLKRNASKTCKAAGDRYIEFENGVGNLSKSYKEIEKNYSEFESKSSEIGKQLNETSREAINNKNNFELLKLPDSVIENYLNETEVKLHDSVEYLQNNTDILMQLLNAANKQITSQISQQNEVVMKTLSKVGADLNIMKKTLQEYEDAFIETDFDTTTNGETAELIKLIEEGIAALENKIKMLDFSDDEKKLLGKNYANVTTIQSKREKLIKYRLLLDAIPASEEKLQEIESTLIRFKITISLTQQLNELKKESEHLKKLRDEYLKVECSQEGLLT